MPMTNKSVVAELLGLVEKWRKKACDDNRRKRMGITYLSPLDARKGQYD